MSQETDVELRLFEPTDHTAIERMAIEIVADGTVFPFESVEGTLAYWFGPRNDVFVATSSGRVVGSYVIKPNQPDRGAHVANAGYMVSASQRGKGLGRKLGEHSIETARSLGYRAMQFNYVVATNESAVHLWKSLGFRVLARVPGAFRHPTGEHVDVLVMFRELADT